MTQSRIVGGHGEDVGQRSEGGSVANRGVEFEAHCFVGVEIAAGCRPGPAQQGPTRTVVVVELLQHRCGQASAVGVVSEARRREDQIHRQEIRDHELIQGHGVTGVGVRTDPEAPSDSLTRIERAGTREILFDRSQLDEGSRNVEAPAVVQVGDRNVGPAGIVDRCRIGTVPDPVADQNRVPSVVRVDHLRADVRPVAAV